MQSASSGDNGEMVSLLRVCVGERVERGQKCGLSSPIAFCHVSARVFFFVLGALRVRRWIDKVYYRLVSNLGKEMAVVNNSHLRISRVCVCACLSDLSLLKLLLLFSIFILAIITVTPLMALIPWTAVVEYNFESELAKTENCFETLKRKEKLRLSPGTWIVCWLSRAHIIIYDAANLRVA